MGVEKGFLIVSVTEQGVLYMPIVLPVIGSINWAAAFIIVFVIIIIINNNNSNDDKFYPSDERKKIEGEVTFTLFDRTSGGIG